MKGLRTLALPAIVPVTITGTVSLIAVTAKVEEEDVSSPVVPCIKEERDG